MSWSADADADADAEVELGRRLYEQGIDARRQPLVGTGAGGVRITSTCAGCHRRSGMGGAEGNRRVPPITAIDLFQAPTTQAVPAPGDRVARPTRGNNQARMSRRQSRDAYDNARLARALREGIDSSGQPLQELMPRYDAIDPASMQALTAYLCTLHAKPSPGWQDNTLHLATVITPQAGESDARAVRSVLAAWTAQRPWMKLHTWVLEGAPSTWAEQLARAYAAQPVFAMLSGAGYTDWQAVQDFCDARTLPCVLPLVNAPATAGSTRWSMYFSTGLELEARALAQVLHAGSNQAEGAEPSAPGGHSGRVIELVEIGRGEAAAHTVVQCMTESSPSQPSTITRRWDPASDALRAALATLGADDRLIAWLDEKSLPALWAALPTPGAAEAGPGRVYLVASLAGFDALPPSAWLARTRLVSSELEPAALRGRTALGLLPWARHAQLNVDDERRQAKVYAAAGFFGDALARMSRRINRDYLMETLERAVDNRPYAGPFVSLSLGPDQRVAGKSADLLQLGGPTGERWLPGPQRLTP